MDVCSGTAFRLWSDSQSELPVSHVEVRRLVERRAADADPFGGPVDQLRNTDTRIPEQLLAFGGVVEQGGGRFDTLENWIDAEPSAALQRDPADRKQLRAGQVQNTRRRARERE